MKKKVLALSLALGAFALILSAGTMAYFTDKTPTISNKFTVGKVDIELDEETDDFDWTNEGVVLMPSSELYKKEVKVTVTEESQDAYVVAKIDLNNASQYVRAVANKMFPNNAEAFANTVLENLTSGSVKVSEAQGTAASIINTANQLLGDYIENFNTTDWTLYGVTANVEENVASFYIVANGPQTANTVLPVFDGIKLSEDTDQSLFEGTNFSNSTIDITGYAIQAEGFDDQDSAIEALFEEAEITDFSD